MRTHAQTPMLLSALILALIALVATSAPARADLRVCNESTNQVSIALGYRADKGWQSEGWWVAAPTKCAMVFQGDLHSRFFYLYVADDVAGGAWDGTNFMCTRDETFTIFGVEDCLARGYERTGFFELDTQNKSNWTLKLTDTIVLPAAGAASPAPDIGPSSVLQPDVPVPAGGDVTGGDPGTMD